MASFPDFLYRLTPRDEQVTQIEALNIRLTGSTATTITSTSVYTVPLGKNLLINSVGILADSASSYPWYVYLEAYLDASVPVLLFGDDTNYGLDEMMKGGPMNCLIPEGWSVRATGRFNAALANNNVFLGLNGVLIPRGNVSI